MPVPKIELRAISVNERMSEETTCYSATLYVDGALWGEVGNRGCGGADDFHGAPGRNYGDIMDLDEVIASESPKVDLGGGVVVNDSLEQICSRLVMAKTIEKDFKRMIARQFLYTRPDRPGIFQVALKAKGGRVWTPEAILASYQRQGIVIDKVLNTMPAPEALALYSAFVS
jgi:hypothetical protein